MIYRHLGYRLIRNLIDRFSLSLIFFVLLVIREMSLVGLHPSLGYVLKPIAIMERCTMALFG